MHDSLSSAAARAASGKTELEARAEGHTPAPLMLDREFHEACCDADGNLIADCAVTSSPDAEQKKRQAANAAFTVLAWNAHEAMKAALEKAYYFVEIDDNGFFRKGEKDKALLAQIDAALALARGQVKQ